MNAIWQAIASEAELAAEHLAMGVTMLGKTNYAQKAYYYQTFFALTIGLERAAKLALVIDHALENYGAFPPNKDIRRYNHNLKSLLNCVDQIAERHRFSGANTRLPHLAIHNGIIEVLSDFANNVSRYYNIDIVTKASCINKQNDPILAWYQQVTLPIYEAYCKPHYRRQHKLNARVCDNIFSDCVNMIHHKEDGEMLNSVYEASIQTAITEFVKPYARMHTMQIIRFLAVLISELGYIAQGHNLPDIPYLSEFFAIFNNSDKYFKKRKTWSIYNL